MKPFHRTAAGRRPTVSWAAELIELSAVFFAVAVAHIFVSLMGEHADGAAMLMISAAALLGAAGAHRLWAGRRSRPAAAPRASALSDLLAIPTADRELLRLRTTLPDRPGTLAALSGRLAAHDVNILAIQIHPCLQGAVDDLLVAAPRGLGADEVVTAVTEGGGRHTRAVRADLHDLVDPATRALTLAAEAGRPGGDLRTALATLLGADAVGEHPAGAGTAEVRGPGGDPLYLRRAGLPFTPTELSRAQAMVDLCTAVTGTH
jgi:hypothetical protein